MFKFAAFMLSSWSLNTIFISIICMRREGVAAHFPSIYGSGDITYTHTVPHISSLLTFKDSTIACCLLSSIGPVVSR